MNFTEGPLGFPMVDRVAVAVDQVIKSLPKDEDFRYRRVVEVKSHQDVMPGERSDVSWISTESPDRQKEIVRSRGMNDGQFKLNPIVTLDHDYKRPAVGRSMWRKVTKDGNLNGVLAKTVYPRKPDNLSPADTWPPDFAFALVDSGLLKGKSIGFLPTKITKGATSDVSNVIEEWMLLEYACTFLPVQQEAVVQAVSKSTLDLPADWIAMLEAAMYKSDVGTQDKRRAAKYGLKDDGQIKFPINDCADITDAWKLRGHSSVPREKVTAYIKRVAAKLGCDGPWNDGSATKSVLQEACPDAEIHGWEAEEEPVTISQLITLKAIEASILRRVEEIDFEAAAAIGVERAFAKRLGRP